jgi:hypothetical protein
MTTKEILDSICSLILRRRKRVEGGRLWQPELPVGIGLAPFLAALSWALAGMPLGSLAATGATISTHGAVAPNGNSPSYTNWFHNAIAAIQSGMAAVGNPVTDPTAWLERGTYRYVEVIETVDSDPRIDLGFNSWLGIADPSGATAQERGGMVAGVGRFLGNGTKIKLSNVHYSWIDGTGALFGTNPHPHAVYGVGMHGIDYGPDGKLGGGDDVVYENGATATNLVDEIDYVAGGGGFFYERTGDFGDPPPGLTHQGTLNWAANEITTADGYGASNTIGFWLFDDSGSLVTSATWQFTINDIPTIYAEPAGQNQLVLKWGGLGFTLENSATLGPAASWSAVPGTPDSPATVPLNMGKAGFYRLHK